ncbi:carboxyl-terminal PDZ ligand of neuronal nitric oxide synthase protein-like isoform X2 [Xenia sp. Carnegie-2017]|nr:carboxyl-terminal PDZ ligand of neuronal nitric oxide synthase protein-like isoform X2 [Xenia sp. Carnegie-2017]
MMHVVNFNKWAYRLVEDRQDGLSKVPIFDREAFQAGITFKAKYVGTLEITRPTCRSEIVTAMRKVRYEFKIKAIEKRRIFLTISVDGIKVTLRKRRRRLRKEYLLDDEPVILHEHAIGRIFYVSHDSMDLKIFSYITKDNFDNLFRCSVFKAYKKSRALFVVRTIGQAFEVCHRLQQESAEEKKDAPVKKVVDENILADEGTDIDDVNLDLKAVEDEQKEKQDKDMLLVGDLRPSVYADNNLSQLTAEQIRVLFNQQVQHYMQEVERYKSESQLLKDQLILERNARVQSQEREKCLLQKNRELLQTIQTLANRLQKVNPGDDGLTAAFNSPKQPETLLNPGGPSLFSPPFQYNNVDHSTRYGIGSSPEHQGIAGNSMIIAPPSSVIDTLIPLHLSLYPQSLWRI